MFSAALKHIRSHTNFHYHSGEMRFLCVKWCVCLFVCIEAPPPECSRQSTLSWGQFVAAQSQGGGNTHCNCRRGNTSAILRARSAVNTNLLATRVANCNVFYQNKKHSFLLVWAGYQALASPSAGHNISWLGHFRLRIRHFQRSRTLKAMLIVGRSTMGLVLYVDRLSHSLPIHSSRTH